MEYHWWFVGISEEYLLQDGPQDGHGDEGRGNGKDCYGRRRRDSSAQMCEIHHERCERGAGQKMEDIDVATEVSVTID